MARKKAPELTFQQHIADFLIREHKYGVLEQIDITDAVADLGKPEEIGQVFSGFQKYLYQQQVAEA